MFCAQCGSKALEGARFCGACGAPIHAALSESALLLYRFMETRADAQAYFSDMLLILREYLAECGEASAEELDRIICFSEEQFARWWVQWQFSYVTAPDRVAEREYEGWLRVIAALMKVVAPLAEGYEATAKQRRDMRAVAAALRMRAAIDEASGHGVGSDVKLGLARTLNAVGMRTLAEQAVSSAIFPKGTIGAAQAQ